MRKTVLIILLGILSSFYLSAQNGLIFHYPFDGGNTDNQSGSAFSTIFAQQTGAIADVLGQPNSALEFYGSSSELWVDSGSLIDFGLTTSFSFVTDFYSLSTAPQFFFRDLLTNGVGWEIGILNNEGSVTFQAGSGASKISVRTEATYNDNDWHQVALIVDKSNYTIQMFIDGQPSWIEGTICGDYLSGSSLSFSSCNFNANEDNPQLTTLGDQMVGGLDEIMLFNRIITPEEVSSFYASSFFHTPSLVSPTNGTQHLSPSGINLTWNYPGMADFEVEVDLSNSFPSPIVFYPSQTSQALPALNPATTYYWRVKMTSQDGNSEYSDIWNFTTQGPLNQAPALISPLDNSTGINPTSVDLSWESLPDADSYVLEYSLDIAFSSTTSVGANGTTTTISGLSPGTLYYWRVMGENTSGNSPYSAVWSFTTANPLVVAPNLVSPANGATGLNPNGFPLTWDAQAEADSYDLEYETSNAFLSPTVINTANVSEAIGGLNDNTTYYWRVRSKNAVGDSPYSEIWSFTTTVGVGFEEGISSLLFNAHPNPFNHELCIEGLENGDTVTLLNNFGQVVEIEGVKRNGKKCFLETSLLPAGVYFIKVLSPEGVSVQKVLKTQ